MATAKATKTIDVTLPPGRESPDGFNPTRHTTGNGTYHGFSADSDLGIAYAHYKDGMDEYSLSDLLVDRQVFSSRFYDLNTPESDCDPDEIRRAYEAEKIFCDETAFTLFNALEAIRREVEEAWRPEDAAKIIPLLPRLTRVAT